MSLESAKKLGFTASIIQLVMPIAAVAIVIAFYITLVTIILSSVTSGFTPSSPSFWLSGLLPFIIIPIAAVAFAGYILFLIAMYRLSQYYNEKAIFKNVINALIIQIISVSIMVVVMFFVSSVLTGNFVTNSATGLTSTFWSIIGTYFVVIAVLFIVSIYCALLYKRAFYKLAEKSAVDDFKTMGLLYLIGTALAIFGGSIILWIAWIFAAMGFRKLAPASQTTAPFTYYSPVQTPQATTTKPCPTCGAQNNQDAHYCAHCGKQL